MTTAAIEAHLGVKQRGSAAGATDLGIPLLGVRKDSGADLAGADGDYAPAQFDASGNLRVNVVAGGASGGATEAKQDTQITSLASIDTKMTTLAGYVDTLETLIAATNTALGTVNSTLTGLGTNTDGLETLVAATNAALGTVNSALTAMQGYTDGLEALIGTTNTALTTIDGRVDGLEALIGSTNTLITTLNGYVDGLEALAAAAIPAGTNLIGKVGIDQTTPGTTDRTTVGKSTVVQVTLSLDTVAYAAGDLLADTQAITGMTRIADLGAVLQAITVVDENQVSAAFDIYFLSANNSFGAENSAPSINDANAGAIQGKVSVATADYASLGGVNIAFVEVPGLPLKPASGTTTGYLAVVNGAGAPTYGATSVKLNLHLLQD